MLKELREMTLANHPRILISHANTLEGVPHNCVQRRAPQVLPYLELYGFRLARLSVHQE